MGILDKLLDEIKSNDLTQQVRELCDQIMEEEKDNIEHKDCIIKGPNIFLCLEVPGRTQSEIAFLTLEREYEETYITSLWTWRASAINYDLSEEKMPPAKKQKVWVLSENKASRILTGYAKIVKTFRGE